MKEMRIFVDFLNLFHAENSMIESTFTHTSIALEEREQERERGIESDVKNEERVGEGRHDEEGDKRKDWMNSSLTLASLSRISREYTPSPPSSILPFSFSLSFLSLSTLSQFSSSLAITHLFIMVLGSRLSL